MENCHYCNKGDALHAIGIEVAKLSVSNLILFREQSHKGRCIVAFDRHVGDITELNESERNSFFADIARASAAIQQAFGPDKVNYGAFGDTMRHLHFHLVPKYKDGFEWGGVFAMNPQKNMVNDEEAQSLADEIRCRL